MESRFRFFLPESGPDSSFSCALLSFFIIRMRFFLYSGLLFRDALPVCAKEDLSRKEWPQQGRWFIKVFSERMVGCVISEAALYSCTPKTTEQPKTAPRKRC